jgi:hypothetical protein
MDLWTLSDLATPWSLHVAATLRVANRLEAGPMAIADLAAAVSADAGALARILRQLVSRGLFAEPTPGTFALNDAARPLLDSMFLLGLDLNGMGGRMAGAWSTLLTAVRTGRPAYAEVFGRGFWEDLDANPALAAEFDAMMGPAGHGIPDPDVLIDPAEWPQIRTVADLGGGTGALLAEVLKAHPHLHGTLVDLPRTLARSGEIFAPAGLTHRVTLAPQSFFDPLPAGLDLYLVQRVLHDWPDREALTLLTRCAEAARPHGRVVILGGVTQTPTADPDLLMLVLVGGKGRTVDELRALAGQAGLDVRTGRNPQGRFLVECRPS